MASVLFIEFMVFPIVDMRFYFIQQTCRSTCADWFVVHKQINYDFGINMFLFFSTTKGKLVLQLFERLTYHVHVNSFTYAYQGFV